MKVYRLGCRALGSKDEDPSFYEIPISSGLFPAKNTILFAAINQMFLRFNFPPAFPASDKGASPAYRHVGYGFQTSWTDKLPSKSYLIFNTSNEELRLFVFDVELPDDAIAGSGVYSMVDFMPGMMAVSLDFDPRELCDEAKVEIESCQKDAFAPLLKSFSISEITMVFSHPKGMSIISRQDIQCQLFGHTYIALRLPGNVDADSWFSTERIGAYTPEQRFAVCAAVDESIPQRDRYMPGEAEIVQP